MAMNNWLLAFGLILTVAVILPFLQLCWVLSRLTMRSVRHVIPAITEPADHLKESIQPAIAELESLGLNRIGNFQIERSNVNDQNLDWGILFDDLAHQIFVGVSIPELIIANNPTLNIGISSFFADGGSFHTSNSKLDQKIATLLSKPSPDNSLSQHLGDLAIAELFLAHQAKFEQLCLTRQPLALSLEEYIKTIESNSVRDINRLIESKELVMIVPNRSHSFSSIIVIRAAWYFLPQSWLGIFGFNSSASRAESSNLELEIEQFEARQLIQPNKISAKTQRWLLLGSLAMFVAVYASFFSTQTLVILVAVLLFHEGGHVLAMKYFGYRDVTMLFIPFLGALATANKEDASLSQKVWISLAGPLPGLILGIGLAIAFGGDAIDRPKLFDANELVQWIELEQWIKPIILTLIGLNLFNLLPIYPLDGGQVADLLLFSSNPYLGVLFKGLGVFFLLLIGLKQPPFLAFALLIALTIPHSFQVAKLHNRIRKSFKQNPVSEPSDLVRRIFENLQQPAYQKFAFAQKSAIAKTILDSQKERSASWVSRLGLSIIYLVSLVGGMVGGLYAIVPYPQVWAGMAKSLTYIGKDSKAIVQEQSQENIQRANRDLVLNPNNTDALHDRARGYLMARNTQKAFADANQLIKLEPESERGYMLRGMIWNIEKNSKQSEIDYKTGRNLFYKRQINESTLKLQKNPEDSYTYLLRATAYAELNEIPNALTDYDKAIALTPNNHQIYASRGRFYLNQKKYPQAIADANLAIKLNPKSGDGYFIRSDAYRQIGEVAKSDADREKAMLYGIEDE
jgi:tetratricopeptide (TPR) repeat protein